MNARRKINELESHEVECKNVADGKIVWKVDKEVQDVNKRFIKMYYFVPIIVQFMIYVQNLVKRILHNHSRYLGQAILMLMLNNYKKS